MTALEHAQRLHHPAPVERRRLFGLGSVEEGGVERERPARAQAARDLAQDLRLVRHQVDRVAEEDRVGGARVIADKPTEGDVDALLEAWGLAGRKLRELAVMIGTQDGGLRFLGATVQAARVYAKASGREIDERTFKAAAVSVGAWGVQ